MNLRWRHWPKPQKNVYWINPFPACVMVAHQILVLTVGVRILRGELRLNSFFVQLFFSFSDFSEYFFGPIEYRFSSRPSQGWKAGSIPAGTVFFYYGRYSTNFKIKNHYFSNCCFCKKRNCFGNFNFVGNYFGIFCKTKFGIYQLHWF